MHPGRYILDDAGNPVPCDDYLTWDAWMTLDHIRVAREELPSGTEVSTVYMGLDHGHDGPPVLWETMVFGGPHNDTRRRYTSAAAAIDGHQEQVNETMEVEAALAARARAGEHE